MKGFIGTMDRSTTTGNTSFVRGRILDVVSFREQDKTMLTSQGTAIISNLMITLFKRLKKGITVILTDETLNIDNQEYRVMKRTGTMAGAYKYDLLETKNNGP